MKELSVRLIRILQLKGIESESDQFLVVPAEEIVMDDKGRRSQRRRAIRPTLSPFLGSAETRSFGLFRLRRARRETVKVLKTRQSL